MIDHKMKSLLLLSLLVGSLSAYSQAEDLDDSADDSIELVDGLSLMEGNPLAPYAAKKNGKYKNKFKVPFSVMAEYYKYAGQGFILENENPEPIKDIDMDVIPSKSTENMDFFVNIKKKKAYPTEVINPHSISNLFVLDPRAYNAVANAPDFVTAKQKIYGIKKFDKKQLKYDYNMIHLEDWRSLNHPPVNDTGDDLTVWDKDLGPIDYSAQESVFYSPEFQHKIDEISNTELTFGNKVELLENGLSFNRKIEEVNKAKSFVLIAVMSFFCDASSKLLEDALLRKVGEGVDVKIMVEKVWTKAAMMKCMKRMMKGGIDVVLADDLLKKGEEQSLFHDKFMVIDNERVIMGGSNIMASDNISTGMNHMNRDNDVFIEGPIASDATLAFVDLWRRFATKKNAKNIEKDARVKEISHYEKLALDQKKVELENKSRGVNLYAEKLNNPSTRSQGVCRFMNQSPSTDRNKLSKVFIEYIQNAKSRMSMTNGNAFYFDLPEHKDKERARDTWNKKLYRAIFGTVERGVKLDIIGNGIDGGYGEASNMFKRMYLKNRFRANPVPKAIASFLADFMDKTAAKKNQPYLEELARKQNIRAWTHFQYMHSKKMQIDRVVTVVSSYNLDEWSADKSHESAVICLDDRLNSEMEKSFLKDVINSEPAAIAEK